MPRLSRYAESIRALNRAQTPQVLIERGWCFRD